MLKAAVSRQRKYLADARVVQFTRSKDGLGGVLRKALGQGDVARPLHPSVQHMLLLGADQASWLATDPPITERIRRIYGHTMGALDRDEFSKTRSELIS